MAWVAFYETNSKATELKFDQKQSYNCHEDKGVLLSFGGDSLKATFNWRK